MTTFDLEAEVKKQTAKALAKQAKEAEKRQAIRKYTAIALWGMQLRSMRYYIMIQQELAHFDKAPHDAIYFKELPTGRLWICVSDLPEDHSFRVDYNEYKDFFNVHS